MPFKCSSTQHTHPHLRTRVRLEAWCLGAHQVLWGGDVGVLGQLGRRLVCGRACICAQRRARGRTQSAAVRRLDCGHHTCTHALINPSAHSDGMRCCMFTGPQPSCTACNKPCACARYNLSTPPASAARLRTLALHCTYIGVLADSSSTKSALRTIGGRVGHAAPIICARVQEVAAEERAVKVKDLHTWGLPGQDT